jgi:hypothetical protein
MLRTVTFSGVDNRTDSNELKVLQNRYPFLEFGILVSVNNTNTGENNRYPDISVIEELRFKGLNLSCHLCGSMARDAVQKNEWHKFYHVIGDCKDLFKRIQLNVGSIQKWSTEIEFPKQYDNIIQISSSDNLGLFYLYNHLPNIFGFHDNSGGRGIIGDGEWMHSDYDYFGYAGGISVDNVKSVIEEIMLINKKDFWIDMESSIRTDDWLDIEKCAKIAEICSEYVR